MHAEQGRLLRAMTPGKKLRVVPHLYHSARELKGAGLRAQHREWGEGEITNELHDVTLHGLYHGVRTRQKQTSR